MVKKMCKKTNQQIANEVIAGLWGNNEDRKIRLTNAGYDYYSVQSIVNAILQGNYVPEPEPTNEFVITGTETLKLTIDLTKYNAIEVTFINGGDE